MPGRKPACQFCDSWIGIAAGTHGDEGRQVLVLRAQSVGHPGTDAGPDQPRVAAVHQQQRRFVVRHVGVHRADDGDVVDRFGDVAEQISLTSMPLSPYFWNLKGDGNAAPVGRSVCRLSTGSSLPGILRQRRLGIERVDVRRSAVHEQMNDVLGLGRKMRRFRQQRIPAANRGIGRVVQQLPQGQSRPVPSHTAAAIRVASAPGVPSAVHVRARSDPLSERVSVDKGEFVRHQQRLREPLPDVQGLRGRPAETGRCIPLPGVASLRFQPDGCVPAKTVMAGTVPAIDDQVDVSPAATVKGGTVVADLP